MTAAAMTSTPPQARYYFSPSQRHPPRRLQRCSPISAGFCTPDDDGDIVPVTVSTPLTHRFSTVLFVEQDLDILHLSTSYVGSDAVSTLGNKLEAFARTLVETETRFTRPRGEE